MPVKKNQAEGEPQQPEESTDTKAEGDEPKPEEEGDDEPEPEHSAEDEPDPEDEDDEPDEDAEGDEPEEEDEEDDEPMNRRSKKTKASASRPRSTAEILGLRPSASQLAIKNAARRMRSTLDAVMAELEVESDAELVGAAKAVAGDARRLAKVEATNRTLQKEQRAAKRLELAKRLAAASLPGLSRGDVFIDKVNESTGKVTTKLAPEYRQMKLETFEAFVNRKLKNGGSSARRRTPFDPDRSAAASASAQPDLDVAKRNPVVIRTAKRTGKPLDEVAAVYAAQFPDHARQLDPAI